MRILSTMRALMVVAGLSGALAHANVEAVLEGRGGGGGGDLCDPGTGPNFQTCTWNGSPTIMKMSIAEVSGATGVDVEVNTTAFDGSLADWNEGFFVDLDTETDDYRFYANGFTLWLAADLMSGSWLYDGNGPEVTYFVAKHGSTFDVTGDGSQSIRQSTFTVNLNAFSHITFYDSGDEPFVSVSVPVPAPASALLLGAGLLGLAMRRRRS